MLRRGDGTGHFAAPVVIGTGFSGVRPAGRRRRHDRRRLAGPDGPARGRRDPDLPGQRAVRPAAPATSPTARSARPRRSRSGRWNADGAPDTLFRKGAKAVALPGQRPRRPDRQAGAGPDLTPYDWVIGISDIGLTGHADLVVRKKSNGALFLLPGAASGFGKPRFLAEGMGGYDLAG